MLHEIFKGTTFLIHIIGKDKENLVRVVQRVPCAFQAKFLLGHFLLQPKLKESFFYNILLYPIFPHRIKELQYV